MHYAAPLRRISIWEVHVHNYMATVPLYLLMLIVVLNWDVVQKLVTFDWAGQFDAAARWRGRTAGRATCAAISRSWLCSACFRIIEENIRCLRARERRSRPAEQRRMSAYVTSTGAFLPGPPDRQRRDGRHPRVSSKGAAAG